MKVVLAIPNTRERERVGTILRARGFDVDDCPDREVTVDAAGSFYADVVVCHDRGGSIRNIRAAASDRRVYIIAMLTTVEGKSVHTAMEDGADDFMVMRACSEEVVARVEMPDRIAAWAGGESEDKLKKLIAWQDAPRLLSQEVGAMFGVFAEEGVHMGDIPDYAAHIIATSPEDGTEVEMLVGLTADWGNALAELVFGGPVLPAAMGDIVREIANSVGGAFKRTAMSEGVTVTIGLPQDCPATEVMVAERVWLAECDQFKVMLGMSAGSNEAQRVRASDLKPGMVLKHEVRNAAGALLVAAGTAVTERTAERLVEFCGASALFDVLEPTSVETNKRAVNG